MESYIQIKHRAKPRFILIDEEDKEKLSHHKWLYFNYGRFIGYNVKHAGKERVCKMASLLLAHDNQKEEVVNISHNPFDCRKKNLTVIPKRCVSKFNLLLTEEGKKHLEEYNNFIISLNLNETITQNNLREISEIKILDIEKPKPRIKEINIEGIPEELKEFLYYVPVTEKHSDYFYVIGHPKIEKRRLQGTKSKSMTTEEKLKQIINKINN